MWKRRSFCIVTCADEDKRTEQSALDRRKSKGRKGAPLLSCGSSEGGIGVPVFDNQQGCEIPLSITLTHREQMLRPGAALVIKWRKNHLI